MRTFLFVLFLTGVLACTACDDGGSSTATNSPTQSTSETPGTPDPAEGPSGVADVDAAIEALASGNVPQLVAMVRLESMECVGPTPGRMAALFCREGEEEGTASQVLPIAGCESGSRREDELTKEFQGLVDAKPVLYGVYPSEDAHILVYGTDVANVTTAVAALYVEDGDITLRHYGCGQTPQQFVAFHELEDPVVAPPPTAEVEPLDDGSLP
jgi:hypothetical protein